MNKTNNIILSSYSPLNLPLIPTIPKPLFKANRLYYILKIGVYLGIWVLAGCKNREEIKCQNLIEAAWKIKMICGCFCYLEIQMKRRLGQTWGRNVRSFQLQLMWANGNCNRKYPADEVWHNWDRNGEMLMNWWDFLIVFEMVFHKVTTFQDS